MPDPDPRRFLDAQSHRDPTLHRVGKDLPAFAWLYHEPVVDQNGSVTVTVDYSRFLQIGTTVIWGFHLTVTGNGSALNIIYVDLPVTAKFTTPNTGRIVVGTGQIVDNSASAFYQAAIALDSGTDIVFYPTAVNPGLGSQFLGLTQFTAALASDDIITGTVTYEAGSLPS